MTGKTHRAIAVAISSGVATAASLEWRHGIPLVLGAFVAAKLPDRSEKWFRALGWKVEHRKETHLVYMGLPWTLIVFLVLLIVPDLLVELGAQRGLGGLRGPLEAMPVPFALGFWLGYCSHPVSDSWTDNGSWIWSRRRVWTLPAFLRIHVYRTVINKYGEEVQVPSRGDTAYRLLAVGLTLGFLVLHLAGLGPHPFTDPR